MNYLDFAKSLLSRKETVTTVSRPLEDDDEYIASLILSEATSAPPSPSKKGHLNTNKRFLANVISQTQHHNSALNDKRKRKRLSSNERSPSKYVERKHADSISKIYGLNDDAVNSRTVIKGRGHQQQSSSVLDSVFSKEASEDDNDLSEVCEEIVIKDKKHKKKKSKEHKKKKKRRKKADRSSSDSNDESKLSIREERRKHKD